MEPTEQVLMLPFELDLSVEPAAQMLMLPFELELLFEVCGVWELASFLRHVAQVVLLFEQVAFAVCVELAQGC